MRGLRATAARCSLLLAGGCGTLLGADFEHSAASASNEEGSSCSPEDACADLPHETDGAVKPFAIDGASAAHDSQTTSDTRQRDAHATDDGALASDGTAASHADVTGGCQPPQCGTGQRCVDDECVCDAISCPDGCCRGSKCVHPSGGFGTVDACAKAGQTCTACGADEVCTRDGTCELGSTTMCIFNNSGGTLTKRCSGVCATQGRICASGCFPGTGASVLVRTGVCDPNATVIDEAATCTNSGMAFGNEESIFCCCL